MERRTLYVGLSKPCKVKIFSILIRWAESPKKLFRPATWFKLYHSSHVFTLYPAKPSRPFFMVQEAAGVQVRFMSQENFLRHSQFTKLYEFNLSKPLYDDIKTYGERFAGTPYALMENVGIALVRLLKIFGILIANPFSVGEDAQKCSEIVARNIILRMLDCNIQTLSSVLAEERGVDIPDCLDTVGVRDIEEALEMLADWGVIERKESLTL